jgi:rSAM/selenodomain-associated transferase 1
VFETIPPPPNRLLVFARLPERGKVKTRLARDLGDDRTLAVYKAMLHDLLGNIGTPNRELDIEVLWAPTETATGDALRHAFGDFPLAMQTGKTLTERLSMAFAERFFFHFTQKIVAIGVDEPSLDRAVIDQAFAVLESCDWVVGPAGDGGYYLIGCRAAAYDSEIFRGIDWGTEAVFAQTLFKIRQWQTTVAVLPLREDIDVGEDLRRFASTAGEGEVARLVREWRF